MSYHASLLVSLQDITANYAFVSMIISISHSPSSSGLILFSEEDFYLASKSIGIMIYWHNDRWYSVFLKMDDGVVQFRALTMQFTNWFGNFSIIYVSISDLFDLHPDMSSPISNSKDNVAATTSIIDLTVILFTFNWVLFIFWDKGMAPLGF